jgi:transposase
MHALGSKEASMRRYELTDEAWERLQPLMPARGRPGGRWNDHRRVLNGMFWVLNSGAPWRDMPPRYGKWQSIYDRFRRWTRAGLFDRILATLQLQLDDEGRIDWSQFDIDGSSIRAQHAAAGARKKGDARKNRQTTGLGVAAGVGARSFIW